MPGVTVHMVVKNEDYWVWYAIQAILPHVDQLFITDTGSTDQTLEKIKTITSPKLRLSRQQAHSPSEVTRIRNQHINQTKTSWLWIIDGDELYHQAGITEIKSIMKQKQSTGIIVRRYDLLGDVYHAQVESVGSYSLHGQTGHFSTRLLNKSKIPGLHYKGDYPNEGFYDSKQASIHTYPDSEFIFTQHKFFHTTYLQRSSQGSVLKATLNRQKYKIETGVRVSQPPPEVLYTGRSSTDFNPLAPRSFSYELAARLVTPIKKLKRRWL